SLIFYTACLFAQQNIEGIIYDKDTKQRVAKVYIYNTNKDKGIFNNLKGEFNIEASAGDVLIAATEGYFPDTVSVKDKTTLVWYLKRSSIMLKEVSIVARKSPHEVLEQNKEDYNTAYKKGDPGSFFTVGNTGAGLS